MSSPHITQDRYKFLDLDFFLLFQIIRKVVLSLLFFRISNNKERAIDAGPVVRVATTNECQNKPTCSCTFFNTCVKHELRSSLVYSSNYFMSCKSRHNFIEQLFILWSVNMRV